MVALEEGESIVLSEEAWNRTFNLMGVLTLTNRRLLFEVTQRVRVVIGPLGREEHQNIIGGNVNIPREKITHLQIGKALLGGQRFLSIGSTFHMGEYQVQDPEAWVAAVTGGPRPATPDDSSSSPPPLNFQPPPPPPLSTQPPIPPPPPPDGLSLPRCPLCGSVTVRTEDGSLRCPKCSPGG